MSDVQPDCIVTVRKDGQLEYDLASVPQPIDEWPHKWNTNPITYSVIRGTDDMPGNRPERLAMNLAMTTWDIEIEPNLKWVPFDKNPDITIEFKPSNEDELFKKRPGVLAYAYFPGQGDVSGVIVFNDDYEWGLVQGMLEKTNPDGSVVQVKIYNVIHTMIHEIGHSLGLKHAEDCSQCVMYPYYNGTLDLNDWDIVRIRRKYGIRTFIHWIRYVIFKKWLSLRVRRFATPI